MQESFAKELGVLTELGPETFVLRGSTLIVEILEPEEIKTKSGLVIAQDINHSRGNSVAAHRVEVGQVLMAGEGYWVEPIISSPSTGGAGSRQAGYFDPLPAQPGAVVVLPQYSTQLMSHFPGVQRPTNNKLAMVKMDQVLAYYPTQEAYNLAKEKMNGI